MKIDLNESPAGKSDEYRAAWVKAWSEKYDREHPEAAMSQKVDRLRGAARDKAERRLINRENARQWHREDQAAQVDAPPRYGWCGCSGPRPGEPQCPCRMRLVLQRGGRWWKLGEGSDGQPDFIDIGPVS